jgi:sugar phosphate permease
VWGTTWLAYAAYYLGRKVFAVAKHSIGDAKLLDITQMGYIDSGYLGAYALGQFLNGTLGDRVGARRLVGFGLMASAALSAAFGSSSTALVMMALWTVNGVAQATGWPGVTRAMTEWTEPETRGTVMGFWSTCYQAGPIIAGTLAGALLVRGWRTAFHVPAAIMVGVALLVLLIVRPGPVPAGTRQSDEAAAAERRLAQREVVKSPVLWSYGASYFFIKFMRYAVQLWLPYYLTERLHYEGPKASYVSNAFEVGGLLGVIAIGALSDRLRLGRVGLSVAALIALSLSLFGCAKLVGDSTTVNVALFALSGALLFAPDSILCGAAAQDVGGRNAASMATGFVNGIGSIGAFLVGLALPALVKKYGWDSLFPFLVAMALLGALCLIPALRRPVSARVHA